MNFIEKENYESMSETACKILVDCLIKKPDTLFCIATGHSPTETYRLFVEEIKRKSLDTSKMGIVKLDEWYGLEKGNPATCEFYLHQHLLEPLSLSEKQYISFNPLEKNAAYECDRVTSLIENRGGIDCCILGIGKNGHLGLNEPAHSTNPFAHKAYLDAKTQTHSMLSSNHETVSEGYTLGIKDILDARKIILLMTGADKQNACDVLKQKTLNPLHPANYLWLHNDTTCIIDNSSL